MKYLYWEASISIDTVKFLKAKSVIIWQWSSTETADLGTVISEKYKSYKRRDDFIFKRLSRKMWENFSIEVPQEHANWVGSHLISKQNNEFL